MSLIDMFPISSRMIDGPASLRIASDKVVFTAMHLQILENEFENDPNPERRKLVDGFDNDRSKDASNIEHLS